MRFKNGGGRGGMRAPRPSVARVNPPPGGFAAAAQQTAATQAGTLASFFSARGPSRYSTTTRTRKRKRRVARLPKRKRKAGKRAHLVRGSAAAKRHMAKLRRMQKRRR